MKSVVSKHVHQRPGGSAVEQWCRMCRVVATAWRGSTVVQGEKKWAFKDKLSARLHLPTVQLESIGPSLPLVADILHSQGAPDLTGAFAHAHALAASTARLAHGRRPARRASPAAAATAAAAARRNAPHAL